MTNRRRDWSKHGFDVRRKGTGELPEHGFARR